jgi:hypothetical protein
MYLEEQQQIRKDRLKIDQEIRARKEMNLLEFD